MEEVEGCCSMNGRDSIFVRRGCGTSASALTPSSPELGQSVHSHIPRQNGSYKSRPEKSSSSSF